MMRVNDQGQQPSICFVTRERHDLPGAQLRCHALAGELRRLGWHATVFSLADDLGALSGEREHEMGRWDQLHYIYRAWTRLRLLPTRTIVVIQRAHYHSLAPWWVAVCQRNPLVLDIDDWEMREDMRNEIWGVTNSKAEWLLRLLVASSHQIIASSRYLEAFLHRYGKPVRRLVTPVDTDQFSPRLHADTDILTCGWIGTAYRSSDVDNVRWMMEALNQVQFVGQDMRLVMAGKGTYWPEIKRMASSSTWNYPIECRDNLDHECVPLWLASCDIGLLPYQDRSRFHRSKSPAKLVEYMAMGLPVVATRIGEAVRMISHGKNGWLASGQADFARGIRHLESAERRQQWGARARADALQHYSLKRVGHQLSDWMLELWMQQNN